MATYIALIKTEVLCKKYLNKFYIKMIDIKLINGKIGISEVTKLSEFNKFELAIQDFVENVGECNDVYLSNYLVNLSKIEDNKLNIIEKYRKELAEAGWNYYTFLANNKVIFFKKGQKKLVDDILGKLDKLVFNDIKAFDSKLIW